MRVGEDILEWIVAPIEAYLSGRNQDAVFDCYYQERTFKDIVRYQRQDELGQAMKPYIVEYLLYPENRIYKKKEPYMVTGTIHKAMQMCNNWANMTGPIEWFEFIDKHAEFIHQGLCYDDKCTFVLSYMSRKGYREDWDVLYFKVKSALKDTAVRKDSERLELYAFLMAVIMIERSNITVPEKHKQQDLLYRKWHIINYLYSLVLGKIIGTKYTSFVQLVAQTRSNKSRLAYGHLFVKIADWMIKRNPQMFAKEYKFLSKVEQLRQAVSDEYEDHDLDLLTELLFPEIFGKKVSKPNKKAEIALVEDIEVSLRPDFQKRIYESYLKTHPEEIKPIIQVNHNVMMTGDHATYNENSGKEK